jgi:enoyl-CoA hydratase/carnithine racemase
MSRAVMQSPNSFRFEVQDRVGLITLSRPDTLNSLTFEVYRELRDLFFELEQEPSVRSVVITGEGRAFCSGGDINAIIGELLSRDLPGLVEFSRLTCDLVRNIRTLRKPVIAAINGIAAGAGAAIALASDLRIASLEAKISFLFVKVGLAGADMGTAFLLPRLVGLGRATELLLLGDAVDAATAERYGLFNRVVQNEKLLEEALGLARRLASGPSFGIGITKELLNAELSMDLNNALDNEARAQAICMSTQDFKEAHQAFTEKRAPRFTGK